MAPTQADYLTNYEVGWKTQWFDNHVRWNGAVFWEDWKNFQFSFLGANSVNIIENGGNARINGIENELEWLPFKPLRLSANFTFLDPKLTENYCGSPGVTNCPTQDTPEPFLPGNVLVGPQAPAGTNLPITPKFKGSFVARYSFTTVGGWAPYGQARGSTSRRPRRCCRVEAAPSAFAGVWSVDLAAGIERGNKLDFYITISNL